jgi:O-antigen/teichoic acid export membrane protein
MIVAGGSETLLPRFSTTRDPATTRNLFWNGTWSALVISLILLIPLIVLLPDFLRLWINAEFASKGSFVGQLVAFSFIAQGAFATPAAFYRGTGKPWFVTAVIFAAGIITLVTSILLIPRMGLSGIGYAYAISSLAPTLGTIIGWVYAFGRDSIQPMLRWIALPSAMGLVAYLLQTVIRGYLPDLNWFTLVLFGGLFTIMTAAFIFIADISFGGEMSPARQFIEQAMKSRKVNKLMRLIPSRRAA